MFRRTPSYPYCHLMRSGAWIHFSPSRERTEFLRVADVLRQEFNLKLVETFGGVEADAKEYWTFANDRARLLLMRCCCPRGISLEGATRFPNGNFADSDNPTIEAIARRFNAEFCGWRWKFIRFLRWFCGPFRSKVQSTGV